MHHFFMMLHFYDAQSVFEIHKVVECDVLLVIGRDVLFVVLLATSFALQCSHSREHVHVVVGLVSASYCFVSF